VSETWKIEWDAIVANCADKNAPIQQRLEILKKFSEELSQVTGGKAHAEGYRTARAEFAIELKAFIESLK